MLGFPASCLCGSQGHQVSLYCILSVAVVSQWLYGPYLSALGLTYHNESQRIPGVKSRNFRRISGKTEVKTFMIRYM